MTKEFAPGLALDTGEFIPASDLNAQMTAPPVPTSATWGDWREPTTVAQRLGDVLQLLCGGKRPPDDVVLAWLNTDDTGLQSFCATHGPAWAQGIGLIDLAMVAVARPTEGVDHEHVAVEPQVELAHAVLANGLTTEETFATASCSGLTEPRTAAAYAEMPTSNYAGRVYEEGFLTGTCPLYTADQMRAFADATHALRAESLAAAYREELDKLSQRNYELRHASHGQAPAGLSLRTDALCDLSYSHGLKAGWNYCASDDLAGFERAQKIGTDALCTLKSTTAQADPLQPVVALQEIAGMYADDFKPQADSQPALGLQTLHNLLYLAQRQTSKAAMERVVSQARLELARMRDASPHAASVKAASTGELLMGLAVIRELTGTQKNDLESTVDAVRAAFAPADSVLEDAARLDWLDQNIFYREMDEWDAKHGRRGDCNMWVLFAPKGAHSSARKIIDAARAAQEKKA